MPHIAPWKPVARLGCYFALQGRGRPLVSPIIGLFPGWFVTNLTQSIMKAILITMAATLLAVSCCPTAAPEKPAYVAPAK